MTVSAYKINKQRELIFEFLNSLGVSNIDDESIKIITKIDKTGYTNYYLYYNLNDDFSSERQHIDGIEIPAPYLTPQIDDCIKALSWDYHTDGADISSELEKDNETIKENENEDNKNVITEELKENEKIDSVTLKLKALKIAVQLLTSKNTKVELEDAIDVAEQIEAWANGE